MGLNLETNNAGGTKVLRQSITAAQLQAFPAPIPLQIPQGLYKFVSAAIVFNGTVPMNFGAPLFLVGSTSTIRYGNTVSLSPAPVANYAAMFDFTDYTNNPAPESYEISANNFVAGDCTAELLLVYTDLY